MGLAGGKGAGLAAGMPHIPLEDDFNDVINKAQRGLAIRTRN